MPISIVVSNTYKHGGCMITIGKIPQKVNAFFKPIQKQVSAHVYSLLLLAGRGHLHQSRQHD